MIENYINFSLQVYIRNAKSAVRFQFMGPLKKYLNETLNMENIGWFLRWSLRNKSIML